MVASDIAPQIAESSGSASTDSGYKSTAPDSVGAGTAEQERCLRARFGPRDAAFFKARGYDKPVGVDFAGIWASTSFSWIAPLLQKRGQLDEESATPFVPERDDAGVLAYNFDKMYAKLQARGTKGNLLFRTLLALHWPAMAWHAFWTAAEVAVRLAAPVLLRELLRWLRATDKDTVGGPHKGWLWAILFGLTGLLLTIVHHQLFWYGMRMGFETRQQAIAAIQAKVLRLNSTAISDVTNGKIVNLVSNDVRRFDDAGPFWVFLFLSPIELACVVLMISLELGAGPAFAGIAVLLALLPIQAVLSRYIGRLRDATAERTDERVRLEGEAISGALAMKMLGWEQLLLDAIERVRTAEAACCARMNRVRAANMALQFAIVPVSAFVTFSVVWAQGNALQISGVFYTLALLNLPQLYIATFFTRGVETASELRISLRRLNAFLALPEPPPPSHLTAPNVEAGSVEMRGADYDWNDRSWAMSADKAALSAAAVLAPDSALSGLAATGASPHQPAPAGGRTAVASQGGRAPAAAAGPSTSPQLGGIRFALKRGELLGICGEVGCGKSSIVAALLGELQPMLNPGAPSDALGAVMCGQIAYCSQVPWIVAASVEDNIVFGEEYNGERYQAAVAACALEEDIASLPAGSATELGERGINLSGGQKARLALARAAYSRPDIALLDDPLSAVDSRVGRVLFDKCIGPTGLLAGTTRVLVTHQRQFLPACDRLLVIRHGRIAAAGTWAELDAAGDYPELQIPVDASLDDDAYDANVRRRSSIDQTLDELPQPQADSTPTQAADAPPVTEQCAVARNGVPSNGVSKKGTAVHFSGDSDEHFNSNDKAGGTFSRPFSWSRAKSGRRGLSFTMRSFARRRNAQKGGGGGRGDIAAGEDFSAGADSEVQHTKSGKLVVTERSTTGSLSWHTWVEFARYMGLGMTLLLAVLMVAGQAVFVAASYWLAIWASQDRAQQQRAKYEYTYGILSGCVLIISFLRSFLFFDTSLRAGTKMHNTMAHRVLRAPLSFFHTNPTGRLLNRFSKDQGIVDEFLPQVLFDALQSSFMVIGALVLVAIAVPFIIPVFLPLLALFWWVRTQYVITSREVKRLEAQTRSPVFASFSAALKGLATIRAYGAGPRFRAAFLAELDANGAWWFAFISTARWVGFRLDLVAAATLLLASIFAMALHDRLSTRLVGLALSYTLSLSALLQWATRQTAEAENDMTSVERVLQFTHLPQEPPRVSDGAPAPPPGWPGSGGITFQAVTARYRDGLPPVLSDITFSVPGGTSCGVVGRTGSGKSSLMLCLFRLIDITGGRVLIDGLDAASIGIDALRSQLCIIPQDPVLFSGTLRSNLDPGGQHSEGRIAAALQAAQLTTAVGAAGGLDAVMQEGGDNLSVGQRQLLCLARALLQGAKVLALDEATANVDRSTDALIQTALRAAVRGEGPGGHRRTLLVIAHRVDTILDCDSLLVLDRGRLVESGAPGELAARPRGTFARLVAAAGAPRPPA